MTFVGLVTGCGYRLGNLDVLPLIELKVRSPEKRVLIVENDI